MDYAVVRTGGKQYRVSPGARVTAQVVEHTRRKKILVFKMKRRKNERRKRGHRQNTTTLRVLEIVG